MYTGSLLYDAFLAYDLNGNRTRKSGVRLGIDRAHQEIHISYQYDCMGRLTEECRGIMGNGTAMIWPGTEPGSRPAAMSWERTSLLLTGKSPTATMKKRADGKKDAVGSSQIPVQLPDGRIQENLYDGEGLRAGIRESGKLSTFLYYNGEILDECNRESMPIRRRLSGMGISGLQTLEDGRFYARHQDEQGSMIYVTGRDRAVENCYTAYMMPSETPWKRRKGSGTASCTQGSSMTRRPASITCGQDTTTQW